MATKITSSPVFLFCFVLLRSFELIRPKETHDVPIVSFPLSENSESPTEDPVKDFSGMTTMSGWWCTREQGVRSGERNKE